MHLLLWRDYLHCRCLPLSLRVLKDFGNPLSTFWIKGWRISRVALCPVVRTIGNADADTLGRASHPRLNSFKLELNGGTIPLQSLYIPTTRLYRQQPLSQSWNDPVESDTSSHYVANHSAETKRVCITHANLAYFIITPSYERQ